MATDFFTPQNGGQLTECRFVYCYLAKKRDKDWRGNPIKPGEQEYETTILIPKRQGDLTQPPFVGPPDIVAKVWEAWVAQPGVNGQWRQGARWPVLDCDAVNPATGAGTPETEPFAKEKPWARGHWRIKAATQYPVQIVDAHNNRVPFDVYGDYVGFKGSGGGGGDYGVVSISCWAYLTGSGGGGFNVEGIKKTRDGDPIGGGGARSPEQMFGGPAPSAAAPPLPTGYAPQQQAYVPQVLAYPAQAASGYAAPMAPQPGFQQGQAPYAPAPGVPAPSPYAPQNAPGQYGNGAPAGAPTIGAAALPTMTYPSSAPQGMPPQPPVGFTQAAAPYPGGPAPGQYAPPGAPGAAPGYATPSPTSGAPVYGAPPAYAPTPAGPPFGTR